MSCFILNLRYLCFTAILQLVGTRPDNEFLLICRYQVEMTFSGSIYLAVNKSFFKATA